MPVFKRIFDLIEKCRNKVLVGLSITATPDKSNIISPIEPNASSIQERMLAMTEAAARGLRTYAMLCPLLPGIADSPEQIEEMIQFAIECGFEEIFVEPVNARGPGLRITQEELEANGFAQEAASINKIRKRRAWSEYTTRLIRNVQKVMRNKSEIEKLRILLYPSRLLPEHIKQIRKDDAGVIWLGKD